MTLNSPFPQKMLGRYRGVKGVFIIRYDEKVVFVGGSKNIYHACMRYFCKGKKLEAFDHQRAVFEIVICGNIRLSKVVKTLRTHLQPLCNSAATCNPVLTDYDKKVSSKVLEFYKKHSFFEVKTI